MASLGHVAVGLAAGRYVRASSPVRTSAALLVVFPALALLPDLDVVAFRLHIPYAAPFGHRGASHSLLVALVLGVVCGLALRVPGVSAVRVVVVSLLVAVSHGILDALTDGGLGVALLWPLSDARFFAPWQPIPVAPIGMRLIGEAGLRVLTFELVAFLPFLVYGCWPLRRRA